MPEQRRQIYGFDDFRLDVSDRQLLHAGGPVPLPAKAFDMLVVLIENGGRLVGKDELFSRVWPDQIVEESNLAVHVSAIRKALGEKKDNPRYLVTVPGHGYRFIGNLLSLDEEEEEVVIERHSISRLAVESENAAGENEDSLSKNISTPNGGYLSTRDEAGASMRPGAVGWRTLLFAGLGMIVISLGLLFVLKRSRPADKTASAASIKSIGVLPFKPLVAASGDESLEMGMAETLITRLSSLREIKVPPTSAVRKYGGLEQDAVAAGRELQVESVLDGNIQKAGDRLRVTVRLVRVADGQSLWAESFDENFTSVFAVQDRVSEQVAAALAVRLTGEQREVLVKRYTNNTQAYEFFIKGAYSGGTEEGRKKSIEYFQQAIGLDPDYALAYAAMANSYITLGWSLSPHETFPKAAAAARKALELDETISDAHRALGAYKLNYEWKWSEAEREFKRAMELDPNNDGAYSLYGEYLITLGRFDEAIALRKRANDLAGPSAFPVIASLGNAYFYARQYEEAIKQYQRALELNPRMARAHVSIGMTYVQMGKHEEAIAEIKQAISLQEDTRNIAALGYAYAVAGKRDEARKVIDDLAERSKRKYVSPSFIAGIYAGLGERDQAFAWLEKAYQERQPSLTLIGVEAVFDPLRSDPRFADLMRRVGLPS
jgi:DNA-binding winged helix-turn-helix (wHTH) protein/TolB-like protein